MKLPAQMASSGVLHRFIYSFSALDRDENKASLSFWHANGSIHALWSQLRQQIPAGFWDDKKGFILKGKVASVEIAH